MRNYRIIYAIVAVLVAFGIINNPTSRNTL